jgi:signal transduction histidine kinase/ActR/RegA family two-component response regulator
MPMLMAQPERHYGGFADAPSIAEVLLIPFHHQGKPVGTVWVIAHDATRSFDAEDARVLTVLSRFASVAYQLLVARELRTLAGAAERRLVSDNGSRQLAEVAERGTQERLEAELADSRLLQAISAELINQDEQPLYEKLVDAMISIMRSDFASMQISISDGDRRALRMFAHRGLSEEAVVSWATVYGDSLTSCGQAWRARTRVIVPDVEQCVLLKGSVELAGYRKAGVAAVQTTPLLSRSGTLVGMLSTGWRSPHQPTDRDLRLLDILARQAADLIERRQADETLRQADRRKDEFLATLAHELRNPLAPIRNAIQILHLSVAEGAEREWALGVLDRQAKQLSRLVDDLLDVSRITRDRLELRKERVELARIVQAATEASRPIIAERGHELTVSLPDQVVLDADPTRLAQVFSNLLNNAAKYSEPNGRIDLSAERSGPDVIVRVRDYGIGIARDMLSRIFDLFQQVQPSFERISGGLGVGLTLVKRLVEMHGGQVVATSDGINKGSEFVVRLPVLWTAAKPFAPLTEAPRKASSASRVLVVDDYQDIAVSTCRLLRLLGYETRMAGDADSAMEVASGFLPDIALLDIGLPHVSGYELARRIRAQRWGAEVVLIAMTGWGQANDKRRSLEAGFRHHLVKPVAPAELARLLEAAIIAKGSRVAS